MPTEVSRTVVRGFLEEASGRSKTREFLSEWVSSEGLIDHILDMEAAFPSYEMDVLDLVAEDDLVAARLEFKGTHTGDFHGIEATGRDVTMSVAAFYRVSEGRIADASVQADGASLVEQLTED